MRKMLLAALVMALVVAMVPSLAFASDEVVPVYVDIKPGSWPNPINIRSKGVLPVAICGTEDFDVMTIDPDTVRIYVERDADGDGVAPLRWSYEDVATPYTGIAGGGHDLGGDGYTDVIIVFETQELVANHLAMHVGETIPIFIRGRTRIAWGLIPLFGYDWGFVQGKII